MGYPRTLSVPLGEYGYEMVLDTKKDDCNRERPHWHLCQRGRRIGQISAFGEWTSYPDVSASIRKEAEALTRTYRSEIEDGYDYNRINGAS